MPNYHYRAWDGAGHPQHGSMAAENEAQVAETLRGRGLVVGRVELDKDLNLSSYLRDYRESRPLPLEDLALLCRQLATLVGSGVPILQGLHVVVQQTAGRRLSRALAQVAEGVEAGQSLTEALTDAGSLFPPLMLHMVSVGEAGGVLEEVLQRLGDLYEREQAVNQKMRSAMLYPAVVLVAALGVSAFLVTTVLPRYGELFAQQGALLPWPTRFLLGAAALLRGYWYVVLLLAALGVVGYRRLMRQPEWALRHDRWLLRLPVLGTLRVNRAMGMLARTLATLLRTGVPVLPALSVVSRGLGNQALEEPLLQAQRAVRDGRSLTGPLRESALYPPMLLELMAVGEESGNLDGMLLKAADHYDREVSTTVERLTALLEPALVLVLGAIIGFIVLALVMPMFNSWNLIG
ncbi:MAG: type II secretion system F family protein [Bacillota bacterium]